MATKDDVIKALRTVMDPELYIDVWTLGLIYDIQLDVDTLYIKMTFTSMMCPAGPELVAEVKKKTVELIPEIEKTMVEVVFDPPWEPSEDLKAMMGIG